MAIKKLKPTTPSRRSMSISTFEEITKTKPESVVLEAIEAGISEFGENRVQEALIKYKNIKAKYKQVKLHMIGPLQTNKVKKALEIFDFFHSLDRESLAKEFIKNINLPFFANKFFFIQVNTGTERQKSGINLDEADSFVKYCVHDLNLNVIGLMCIPPYDDNPTPHFVALRKLAKKNKLQHLSMGMSSDYKIALNNGATFIRIGSYLFGDRQ